MKNIVENQYIKTDKPLPMSYEALKAERDALAVENGNQRDWINKCSELWDAGCDLDNLLGLIPETPSTDAALAAIRLEAKIEGANELAERIAEMHSKTAPGSNIEKKLMFAAEAAIAYANGLREAK
ncbi:hypothetical protein AM354_21445 [Serratia marcescens]|uniref:hypothetical protein n=1 Tax=Serratia marcescens TaxID=615 RepID=UPI000CE67D2B|nr:hypothetical protein [Serratia marcescens]AVE51979.1 hypothetical protein AM354_21445 [Serratia marcescens]